MESQSDAETINNLEFLDTDESAFNVLVNTKAELPGKDATLKSNENVVGWLNIKDVVDLPIMKMILYLQIMIMLVMFQFQGVSQ